MVSGFATDTLIISTTKFKFLIINLLREYMRIKFFTYKLKFFKNLFIIYASFDVYLELVIETAV